MTIETASRPGRMRLFCHPASSASMRVPLYLRCRGVSIQAIGEWGMVKAAPTEHPLRLHFIRREFGALEMILRQCAGTFAVGNAITLADCFLVPQVRNALLAGIELSREFPVLSRAWENAIAVRETAAVLEEAGGIVQPFAFDAEKFETCATSRGRKQPADKVVYP